MGKAFECEEGPGSKTKRLIRNSSAKMDKLYKASLFDPPAKDVERFVKSIKKGTGCDPNSFYFLGGKDSDHPKTTGGLQMPWMHVMASTEDFFGHGDPDNKSRNRHMWCKKMIAEGGDVLVYWNGHTPFEFAVTSLNIEIVQCLFEHGADAHLNDTQGRGETPLSKLLARINATEDYLKYKGEDAEKAERLRVWLVEKGAKETKDLDGTAQAAAAASSETLAGDTQRSLAAAGVDTNSLTAKGTAEESQTEN